MNSRNAIQIELNDLRSSLPADNKQPVFTVPNDYFENFAASVLAKVKSRPITDNADEELKNLSPVLAAISKRPPFSVPENYFSQLATGLPALVNEAALPEFLQSHTKQMPYPVPTGYFEGLAAQVAAKVMQPKAKVISLQSRFMRYAAAAVVAGILVTGGIFYLAGNQNSLDPALQPDAWVAQKLKNVSSSDLEAFLTNTGSGFTSKELAQKGSKAEVRQMLRDVSTTELDVFLAELPADNDMSNLN